MMILDCFKGLALVAEAGQQALRRPLLWHGFVLQAVIFTGERNKIAVLTRNRSIFTRTSQLLQIRKGVPRLILRVLSDLRAGPLCKLLVLLRYNEVPLHRRVEKHSRYDDCNEDNEKPQSFAHRANSTNRNTVLGILSLSQ